ncbi:MAG: type II toxin-antitoxin system HicB family antitoxin [Candidatus Latescibacterota bacterium]
MPTEKSIRHYTATYTPISSGYMGKLLDWPEVVTEGATLEECRELLFDALHEMILAYRQLDKAVPEPRHITEQLVIEA